jgi:hypothetical protein
VCIENEENEDIVIIFAEPTLKVKEIIMLIFLVHITALTSSRILSWIKDPK